MIRKSLTIFFTLFLLIFFFFSIAFMVFFIQTDLISSLKKEKFLKINDLEFRKNLNTKLKKENTPKKKIHELYLKYRN